MKKIVMMIMVSLFLVGAVSTASAVVLLPGDTAIVPTGAASPGGTFVTSIVDVPFTGTDIGGTVYFTGLLTETVRSNSTGLLFEYSFTNDVASINEITQISVTDYAGFSTDVDGPMNPALPSINGLSRSNNGVSVTAGYLDYPVQEGLLSGTFWIQTNAPQYTAGSTQFLGTGIATISTLGPAVPEPATVSLLGMGLLGLLGFKRKRTV